jgi:hypothetical protein
MLCKLDDCSNLRFVFSTKNKIRILRIGINKCETRSFNTHIYNIRGKSNPDVSRGLQIVKRFSKVNSQDPVC